MRQLPWIRVCALNVCVLIVCALIAPVAGAAGAAGVSEQQSLFSVEQLFEFALALVAVVAFIYALAWILRRMQSSVQGQGSLRILQGLQVGTKEKLILVQIQDQVLLVGVSAGGLQTLHVLEEPLDESPLVKKKVVKKKVAMAEATL